MFKFYRFFVLVILFILFINNSFSQKCSLNGSVIDAISNDAIPYANIILTSSKDSSLLLGALTIEDGSFVVEGIKEGMYDAKISFVGYNSISIKDIKIDEEEKDIGVFKMQLQTTNLEEVSIKATRPSISYKVDRKVIDAKSFPSADVAMDLLENIPSVKVDFEGNLTYRGDGAFKVFINGHPVPNGVEKLRQISSNKIDKIEVITNPSARYDAEGMAGIIQVILKRNRLQGYAVSASAKSSSVGSYDWSFSLEKNDEKGGWYIEGNVGDIVNKMSKNEVQEVRSQENFYQVQSVTNYKKKTSKSYIECGLNYDITEKDFVDFSLYFDPLRTIEESSSCGDIIEKYYNQSNMITENIYSIKSNSELLYQYFGSTLTYEHVFDKDRTHKFSSYLDFSVYLKPTEDKLIDKKEYSTYIERVGYVGMENNEIFVETDISYINNISKNSSFETGINININHIPELTSVSGFFDNNEDVTPFAFQPIGQKVDFIQDVYSAYFVFKSKKNKFEYQLGIRTEYTDRASIYDFNLENRIERISAKKQFLDFFPTFHSVYNFTEYHQLALNYSRRIERPNYWNLIPFNQYLTPYSYYEGNGNLLPSYSSVVEIAYKKSWKSDFIGVEMFARNANNIIQNYSKIDTANVIAYYPENIGDSWSIGAEIMSGVYVFKWWNINLSTSLYSYSLTTEFNELINTEKQINLNTRFNNTFLLPKEFTLKMDFNYNSPTVIAQGKIDDYYYSNFAISKSFNKKAWFLTCAVSDIFNTKEYFKNINDRDFFIKSKYDIEPYLSFKLTYSFDNQD